jgi:hypothetical protein
MIIPAWNGGFDAVSTKIMRSFSAMTQAGEREFDVHNWGSYSTGQLAIVDCPDCGDPALVENGQARCDCCQQYDTDAAAAMMRANSAVALGVLYREHYVAAGLLPARGRGSMNDERVAFCSYCGDPGVTYPGDMLAEQIDGKRCDCESCRRPGTVRMHDDEGSCWVTFEADPNVTGDQL